MNTPIQVNYKYTNNIYRASQWLRDLPDLFAADFEVASQFTKEEKALLKYRLAANNLTFEQKRVLTQQIESCGLSHPSLTWITHLSIGWSEKDSFVIVCNNDKIRTFVFNFLTTTSKTQLWHNSIFDFSHIYYHTKQLPKSYIDTQLLAKSILNDADSFKDRTSLKELMAYAYGDWAVSKDDFTLEEMWEAYMIRYAATDSCATYKLYQDIMTDIGEENVNKDNESKDY